MDKNKKTICHVETRFNLIYLIDNKTNRIKMIILIGYKTHRINSIILIGYKTNRINWIILIGYKTHRINLITRSAVQKTAVLNEENPAYSQYKHTKNILDKLLPTGACITDKIVS